MWDFGEGLKQVRFHPLLSGFPLSPRHCHAGGLKRVPRGLRGTVVPALVSLISTLARLGHYKTTVKII